MEWYEQALKNKQIDYWNFNCFLRKEFTKRYNIMATRTKRTAIGLGLKRIRKAVNGLWYGVLPPIGEK